MAAAETIYPRLAEKERPAAPEITPPRLAEDTDAPAWRVSA